ncbi:DnaJ domain-containing protein [Metabacillus sp. Hm71]|uniref:DnaJ domain-containing protein n=1 Tax=Metabacillus sp. Hm71 TaxID=3450743 RepID=UPI003F41D3EA
MDIQEAYKVLGVPEDATDDQIEKQYMTWIRRNHAYQSQKDAEKPFDFDKITNAYNKIKAYRDGTEDKQGPTTFREKMDHFLHYYKLHMVGVIILIALCVYITQSVVSHFQEQKRLASLPPENVSIMLHGDYFDPNSDKSPVSDNVLADIPSWERVTVNLNYSPTEVNDSMDVGMQQKSVVTLASDKSDVYVMDSINFEQLMTNEMFLPLDDLEPSLKENVDPDKLIYATSPEDNAEHLYGVVVSDTKFFNGIQVNDEKKIAAIRVDSNNKENALKLLIELTK